MIVDDELGVRESLRAILDRDHDVVTATSGEEAVALATKQPVDVVTLDLRMPGMGGISVLEQLKRIDPDVEVLIITGYGSFETALQGIRHRAFDYIAKPFDIDQVRTLVASALAKRAAVRRLKDVPENILSTLSHELRTPLNVIMGYSTMLSDDLSPEQRNVLDRIQANSTALLRYVDTLFYMAELDRGAVPMEPRLVTVRGVLEHVRDEIAPTAADRQITLHVDAPADPAVVSDEDKLLRLVRVFAENAVRYAASGGTIALRAVPSGDGVVVVVQDDGPGIQPELAAEAIAVAGGDGKPPRLLGFGLRLAGRLIRALGGRLAISPVTGTRWELTIPPLADAAAAPHAPAPLPASAA
jgi:signal transduction histidine kinase